MKKRSLMIGIVAMLFLSACSTKIDDDPDTHSSASLARFREGEVMEYQGKILSPAVGPRDNSINGVQTVDLATYRLTITGLVANPQSLTYDEVLELDLYQRMITLNCVEGWSARILWEGVLLQELIEMAGPVSSATIVIFHATDGYTTSLPYSVIKEKKLILAYKANGIDLPPEMGYPFMVVAEDKLGYKWARWVNEIELSSDMNYQGYWESRGYDNIADVID
ncbi:MAG: hypothetical protein A2Y19_09705 [Firmicutes bacterium GWE2_51_13]|nr:MAG: hypothetical protein A2Y19_09705 [Firmicutes bacterium GWE2_51_13]